MLIIRTLSFAQDLLSPLTPRSCRVTSKILQLAKRPDLFTSSVPSNNWKLLRSEVAKRSVKFSYPPPHANVLPSTVFHHLLDGCSSKKAPSPFASRVWVSSERMPSKIRLLCYLAPCDIGHLGAAFTRWWNSITHHPETLPWCSTLEIIRSECAIGGLLHFILESRFGFLCGFT